MLAELQNITKSYGNGESPVNTIVLDQVSLSIANRESLAIVGPSGSGKSTLLNILGTLDKPTNGRVLLDGIPVESLNENSLAGFRNKFIGFVFQFHHLLPQFSLLENVLLPAIPLNDRTEQKLAAERAHHFIEKLGLKAHLDKRPMELSAGECQRAAVARALVNQPRLLLADEPTGSLDLHNAQELGHLLAEMNRDHDLAVVVVTHSMELAGRMEKVYQLTSGKLHLVPRS